MRKDFTEKGFEEAILSVQKRAELLENNHLTKGMEWSEIHTLAGYLESFQAGAGAEICRQGEKGDFLCLICQGRVDIVKKDISQADKVIASLGPGNTIGEMSLIDGEPRSALAIIHTPATLLILTQENFDRLAENHPRLWGKLVMRIARILSRRLRQTSGILAEYLQE
jgi:CRP-like cAMP-binding protein